MWTDWHNVTILAMCPQYYPRNVKEATMYFDQKFFKILHRESGTLPAAYDDLVRATNATQRAAMNGVIGERE